MVISRVVAPVLQLQEPPVPGWGPNFTLEPALTVTELVFCQEPPFTWMYGVMAVGLQLPLELEEEELLEELDEEELPVTVTVNVIVLFAPQLLV